ncbi:hypothetical protein AQUSIP_23130 [Aquicella siphonis]|uniref:Lysine transporter LysE n=2 Tax=Aquicella siphonis TaxID=254247 RepID=A0A5E4PL78_9COXI|nr:hypothetical protein AQUSIP_23130 [Aquicella siphonis]
MVISMPMGPISILCIQRTLYYGIKIGLVTAIGSALADGVYGSIAAFGFTAITDFLTGYQFWIHLLGSLFLLFLGIGMMRSPIRTLHAPLTQETHSMHAFVSAFFLTITNPVTIFSFMAVFAGLGLGSIYKGYDGAVYTVAGIMVGSTLWEFMLSISIKGIFHRSINHTMMRIINYISGSTILAFAALSFKL